MNKLEMYTVMDNTITTLSRELNKNITIKNLEEFEDNLASTIIDDDFKIDFKIYDDLSGLARDRISGKQVSFTGEMAPLAGGLVLTHILGVEESAGVAAQRASRRFTPAEVGALRREQTESEEFEFDMEL